MRYLLPICFGLAVAACGPSLPLQQVSTIQLNTSIYAIDAGGNIFYGPSQARELALIHASEMCLDNGFTSFLSIESDTATLYKPPSATCSASNCFSYGGGIISITVPSHSMLVKMFKADESAPPPAFSCQIIYDNLADHYKSN